MSRAAVLGPHSPEAAESEHLGMNGTQESAFKLADKVGCEHNFENRCASWCISPQHITGTRTSERSDRIREKIEKPHG